MANRSQVKRQEISKSQSIQSQKDEPIHVAYCLDCDKIIAFDKSIDFVRYQADKHLHLPQFIEDKILIGKIFDLQGELTNSRVHLLSRQI